ncbi:MAG: flagellar basal body P-ring protein FlgI, partial [Hyphomonadaceae bacterium]
AVRLALRNPEFTTAQRMAAAINSSYPGAARAANPGSVLLQRPAAFGGDMVGLLTAIERLEVEPDNPARIVIDETSGVIVMGENVRVSTVAIAQGALTISVTETPQVSQPNAFARQGETVVTPQSNVKVDEGKGGLAMVQGGVPLRQLVDGLNALGVSPRDMIAILQALKAEGAIQAEISVM